MTFRPLPALVIRAMKPCLVSGEDHGCLPLDVKAVRARQGRPRPHGTMEVPVIASSACGDTCTIQANPEWEQESTSNSGQLGRPGWLVRWPRRWGRLPLRGNPNLRSGTTLAEDWQIMTICAEFGRSMDPWAMGNGPDWAVSYPGHLSCRGGGSLPKLDLGASVGGLWAACGLGWLGGRQT